MIADAASMSFGIALGLLFFCAVVAWVWIEIDDARRQKREWRKGRPPWMRIIK